MTYKLKFRPEKYIIFLSKDRERERQKGIEREIIIFTIYKYLIVLTTLNLCIAGTSTEKQHNF